ncbi:hypothetical protein KC717_03300 [Candidatus Dojkabacteria bacterium]|uniref:DUF998 domain-containing protein n=1 Tax=Candidatus Dojkabacteria bacterium TaxID=2099670 RepID=A0A955L8M7_9BACT|nr:hypothetical protein [Candidatus Dojkabacteria bacterium]
MKIILKVIILLISGWGVWYFYDMRVNLYSQYEVLGIEDGILEYSQALFYVLAGIFAFVNSRLETKKYSAWFFLLITVGAFFIALEELSWGQRILNFETGEFFATNNFQSEVNIHNIHGTGALIRFGYIAIGIIGSISWIIKKLVKKRDFIFEILNNVPGWELLVLFILPVFINILDRELLAPQDYEVAEFFLSTGIMIWMLLQLVSYAQGSKSFARILPKNL